MVRKFMGRQISGIRIEKNPQMIKAGVFDKTQQRCKIFITLPGKPHNNRRPQGSFRDL
jgi:hypothetical protein